MVFFAIGFETTTPPTALVLKQAAAEASPTSACCAAMCSRPARSRTSWSRPRCGSGAPCRSTASVGPAHVSILIGSAPYEGFARDYRKPVVIAGFEPLDVMQAILMLDPPGQRRPRRGRERVHPRRHPRRGNAAAQALVAEVFELREASSGAAWARSNSARCASARPTHAGTPSGASNCATIRTRLRARPLDLKLMARADGHGTTAPAAPFWGHRD